MTRTLLGVVGFMASFGVQAATLSHHGYTLDTATNIVTGGGLQWLQWNETSGHTIGEALAENSGWRLASNAEMSTLFNAFDFGMTFTDEEGNTQRHVSPYDASVQYVEHDRFMDLFGVTCNGCLYGASYTKAMYGSDDDLDGKYKMAGVSGQFGFLDILGDPPSYQEVGGDATLHHDFYANQPAVRSSYRGVALVKSALPSAVPLPGAAWLLGSALLVLGVSKRRKG